MEAREIEKKLAMYDAVLLALPSYSKEAAQMTTEELARLRERRDDLLIIKTTEEKRVEKQGRIARAWDVIRKGTSQMANALKTGALKINFAALEKHRLKVREAMQRGRDSKRGADSSRSSRK